jgi:predicted CopG family antitoxin
MTTVRVSEETWQDLNQRKEAGDTFDDVISRLIETRDDGGAR